MARTATVTRNTRETQITLTIDLEAQEIRGPDGGVITFDIDPHRKHCLLNGLAPPFHRGQQRGLAGIVAARRQPGGGCGRRRPGQPGASGARKQGEGGQ